MDITAALDLAQSLMRQHLTERCFLKLNRSLQSLIYLKIFIDNKMIEGNVA